ncbi:thioesterase family protein [Pokkaliibacter sp. CJK22405]|uniref:thioesterase family protein n=1 Tax=Pokkaliibacter sp. CJK22405 TaxID=3384615 RepID=UPI003985322E
MKYPLSAGELSLLSVNCTLEIPEHWSQGRATYGGMLASMMLRALEKQVDTAGILRHASVSFIAPAGPGLLELHIQCLREGRNVAFYLITAVQETIVATMEVTLARGRDSAVRSADVYHQINESPEHLPAFSFGQDIHLEFAEHFDMRWASGALPFSQTEDWQFSGWIKAKKTGLILHPSSLLMLADAWPPSGLAPLEEPVPMSTVNWSIDFELPLAGFDESDWFRYEADTVSTRDGYTVINDQLFNQAGQRLLTTRQLVAIFG